METSNGAKKYLVNSLVLVLAVAITAFTFYSFGKGVKKELAKETPAAEKEFIIPVFWGDLGARLISVGAIDAEKIENLYQSNGELGQEEKQILYGNENKNIKINSKNSAFLLNMFWALGLANKNEILETGEMSDPRYGGSGNFASTAGWTIAKGNPMNHFSRHRMMNLTPDQQNLVEKVSKGIYRPCCGNSTHFPDCNHGMAMLGLLELMASQGASEEEIWKTALAVNTFWFPDQYKIVAEYFKNRNLDFAKINPQEILGANYSSASGFQKVAAAAKSQKYLGASCGIESAPYPEQHSGGSECGVE